MLSSRNQAMLLVIVALCACGTELEGGPTTSLRAETLTGRPEDRIIWTQIPVNAARRPATGSGREGILPIGSRIVTLGPSNSPDGVVVLTPDFAAAGRPDLSFDARRVLFVGQRLAADAFGVWEMNIDGSDVRQVTSGAGDCAEAIYLSTIYTMDADSPVYQIAFSVRPRNDDAASLYTCRMDGTRIRRITFAPDGASDPLLLRDGRLVFSMWSANKARSLPKHAPSGTPEVMTPQPAGGAALFTCHVDGTDLFPFAGVHEASAIRSMPCETSAGRIAYVESDGQGSDHGGSLVSVARTRSLHTRRVVADDLEGAYHSPSPLPDGMLLTSYRPKQGGSYGVYLLDEATGKRARKIYNAPDRHDVDAVAVYPRPEPDGRSSVVTGETDIGQLYALDTYLSNTAVGKRIERGRIDRLRIIKAITANEKRSDRSAELGTGKAREVILGEVPVESDGSFFLNVPARAALRLETLDADGIVLQSMRRWLWVMPGERRGCIGCHEDRELTPPNRHVQALRKDPKSVGVTPPVQEIPKRNTPSGSATP